MSEAVFHIERLGSVAVWTIQREARRNAIDLEVAEALAQAAAEASGDPQLRAVVLTGAGTRSFVAGADLRFLAATSDGSERAYRERDHFNARVTAALDELARLPVPVIAAIHGFVMGGGCEVALACDIRVADDNASFTFKHGALGLTPGWGGLGRLVEIVPRGVAARLLLTGQTLDARAALAAGLVDEVVSKGRARERALELAHAVTALSPAAVADMKRLLTLAYDQGAARARDEEDTVFARRVRAGDHKEALRALAEKRAPVFGPRPSEPRM